MSKATQGEVFIISEPIWYQRCDAEIDAIKLQSDFNEFLYRKRRQFFINNERLFQDGIIFGYVRKRFFICCG